MKNRLSTTVQWIIFIPIYIPWAFWRRLRGKGLGDWL